jgi:hypothetical protein
MVLLFPLAPRDRRVDVQIGLFASAEKGDGQTVAQSAQRGHDGFQKNKKLPVLTGGENGSGFSCDLSGRLVRREKNNANGPEAVKALTENLHLATKQLDERREAGAAVIHGAVGLGHEAPSSLDDGGTVVIE